MSEESTQRAAELSLVLVGLDHRMAGLELREAVACSDEESEELLVELLASRSIAEAAILSTCNRTEVYLRPRDEEAAWRHALERVFTRRASEVVEQGRYYVRRGSDAARHLMAVASGAESMVLGEPEILGQVRDAGELARQVGAAGTVLSGLFRAAGRAGARVRAETAIGTGAVSLGSAVLELAENIFSDLSGRTALLLGAGQTARLVARALGDQPHLELLVANRSRDRLRELQEEIPGTREVGFEDRTDHLATADLVIAATAAPEPILRRRELLSAARRRGDRALLIVDLGVPRNVEPSCAEIESVFLYPLDALQDLIERNLDLRRRELGEVEAILDREAQHFLDWHRGLRAEPLIAALQRRAESIRQRELEAVREQFPESLHEQLEQLTRSLVRKILHHPSRSLRGADPEEGRAQLELARRLFRLDDEEDEASTTEPPGGDPAAGSD